MPTASEQAIEQVIEDFRQGRLTETSLRQALERPVKAGARQDLLYMECSSTGLTPSVLGMNLLCNGEFVTPTQTGEWAYANVLDAVRDGWRIIKFPELALMMIEERNVGLGCEFVLEKWS